MKKILATIALLITINATAFASFPGKGSSIEFGGRFGIGALLPVGELELVNYNPATSYGFDINYTYMVNPFFGFTTGVNFLWLNSSMSSDNVISTYEGGMNIVGLGYSNAHCFGNTASMKEEYKTSFIEIPALLSIHNDHWYYQLGLKFGIPMKMHATFEYGPTEMFVDEVYRTGIVLDSPMPQPTEPGGNGEYDIMENRSRSVFVSWVMEIGYSIDITNNSSISIGAYLDYGLNDASLDNAPDAELLTLNGSNIQSYNGAINSNLLSSIRYYKAGVRLLYNIGFGSRVGGGKRSKRLL